MAQIFISHIEAEKRLASQLETFLGDLLPKGVSFFRSSNIFTLVGGEKFEDRIKGEIAECSAFIMMCSDKSFGSHWIHVEAGAAWVKDKPVIPVCYGGKSRGGLPRPYSSFQAIDLDEPYELVLALYDHLLLRAIIPAPVLSRRLMKRLRPQEESHPAKPYQNLFRVLDEMYPTRE